LRIINKAIMIIRKAIIIKAVEREKSKVLLVNLLYILFRV